MYGDSDPGMADDGLTEIMRMVVEEIKIGLRVWTDDHGTSKGFVTNENLKSSAIELMEGKKGKALKMVAKGMVEAAEREATEGESAHG